MRSLHPLEEQTGQKPRGAPEIEELHVATFKVICLAAILKGCQPRNLTARRVDPDDNRPSTN